MTRRMHYPAHVAGWAYFLGALILLTAGSWVQGMDFKAGMLITEYVLVLLPVLLIGWAFRINLKSALRLKPLKLREVLLIPVIVVLALPITLFLNLLVVTAMAQFGKAYGMPIPSADSLSDLSVLFFIISISAGICEEFFFRGMVLDAYSRRFDAKKGIVISAVMFGLFHFNPQNLLGPIFLGLMFGYLVLITESILAGILAHITNNGVAVLMMYAANLAQKNTAVSGNSIDAFNENPEQMVMALIVLGIIALGSALAVFSLLTVVRNDRRLALISPTADLPESSESDADTLSAAEKSPPGIRLTEAMPLVMLLALYMAVSYYLIILKQ